MRKASALATFLVASALLGAGPVAIELTKKNYDRYNQDHGVVVLDVNWGRRWNCGGYENAELRRIEFDRLPLAGKSDTDQADFVLEGPSRLFTKPTFLNYGFILPPGEYALSGISIKVARSVSEVGYLNTKRSDLIKDGQLVGGSFTVGKGEIAYIGNFFLDCQTGPMLWRYHSDGKEGFQRQLGEYKKKYPFLELERVTFRLFKSKVFAIDYELSQ